MTQLIVVRHGHVEGITPERFRGRAPLKLTAQGRAEAAAVARRVASAWRPVRIYTSPLERCVETAEAIAQACGIAAEPLAQLTDMDYGAWQFKTFPAAKAEDPALFAAWFATPHLVRFPKGESLQDVAARTGDALRLVLAQHPRDSVVIVSHDSVNRVLLLDLLGMPLAAYWRIAQSPCCVNEIAVSDGTVCVQRMNETCHLDKVAR
jgi:phosphoserine phosphatase